MRKIIKLYLVPLRKILRIEKTYSMFIDWATLYFNDVNCLLIDQEIQYNFN